MNQQGGDINAQLITTIITLLLVLIPYAIVIRKIAIRKGKPALASLIIGFIPLVNIGYSIYLISLIDKDIVEIINKLIAKGNENE